MVPNWSEAISQSLQWLRAALTRAAASFTGTALPICRVISVAVPTNLYRLSSSSNPMARGQLPAGQHPEVDIQRVKLAVDENYPVRIGCRFIPLLQSWRHQISRSPVGDCRQRLSDAVSAGSLTFPFAEVGSDEGAGSAAGPARARPGLAVIPGSGCSTELFRRLAGSFYGPSPWFASESQG